MIIVTPVSSNSFGLKSGFEKLRFRDGSVWTVRLTVEITLRFQISLAQLPEVVGNRIIISMHLSKERYL